MHCSTNLFAALAATISMITITTAQISSPTSCIAVSNPETCVLGWQFITNANHPNSITAYIHTNTCALLSSNPDLPAGEMTVLETPKDGLPSAFVLTNPEVGTDGPSFAYEDVEYKAAEACVCGDGPASGSSEVSYYACSCNFGCPAVGS